MIYFTLNLIVPVIALDAFYQKLPQEHYVCFYRAAQPGPCRGTMKTVTIWTN